MSHPVEELTVHGKWLSWLRHQRQEPYRAIAAKLGITNGAVSQFIANTRRPAEPTWRAIAELAGVTESVYWLGPPTSVTAVAA